MEGPNPKHAGQMMGRSRHNKLVFFEGEPSLRCPLLWSSRERDSAVDCVRCGVSKARLLSCLCLQGGAGPRARRPVQRLLPVRVLGGPGAVGASLGASLARGGTAWRQEALERGELGPRLDGSS